MDTTTPDISVMCHVLENTEFAVSGLSVQFRGQSYPSVTVFFPDKETMKRLRNALTRSLDA